MIAHKLMISIFHRRVNLRKRNATNSKWMDDLIVIALDLTVNYKEIEENENKNVKFSSPKNIASLVSIEGNGISNCWRPCWIIVSLFPLHITGDMLATHFMLIMSCSKFCGEIRMLRPIEVLIRPWLWCVSG